MKRSLAYCYIAAFASLLIFGALYNLHGPFSIAELFSLKAFELRPLVDKPGGSFRNVGPALPEQETFHPQKMQQAEANTKTPPRIPERCYYSQAELDEMSDEEANRIVNETINFFTLPPSKMLELEEIKTLSPDSTLRRSLQTSEGLLALKAHYVECLLLRLRPFAGFAGIARPVLLDLVEAPAHQSSVQAVLRRLPPVKD